jgi:hypothetical protein
MAIRGVARKLGYQSTPAVYDLDKTLAALRHLERTALEDGAAFYKGDAGELFLVRRHPDKNGLTVVEPLNSSAWDIMGTDREEFRKGVHLDEISRFMSGRFRKSDAPISFKLVRPYVNEYATAVEAAEAFPHYGTPNYREGEDAAAREAAAAKFVAGPLKGTKTAAGKWRIRPGGMNSDGTIAVVLTPEWHRSATEELTERYVELARRRDPAFATKEKAFHADVKNLIATQTEGNFEDLLGTLAKNGCSEATYKMLT